MEDHIELSKSGLVEKQSASHTLADEALQLMKDNSTALMVAGAVVGATALGAIGFKAIFGGGKQILAAEGENLLASSGEILSSRNLAKDGSRFVVIKTEDTKYLNAGWDGDKMVFGDGSPMLEADPFISAREKMVPVHMEALKKAGR